jgi:hypothetical protein
MSKRDFPVASVCALGVKSTKKSPLRGESTFYRITVVIKYEHTRKKQRTEDKAMRGYYTKSGYYGMVNGRYMLFASESDYFEYMRA